MQNQQHTASPTISVVIPAYNEEKLIGKTLESITSQTYKPFEIIVVDNNSTDKTAAIAKQYGAKVVHESKQGGVYAYNTGMKASKGEIIAVTDADSQPTRVWLATIVKALQPANVVAVTGPAQFDTNSHFINSFSSIMYTLFILANFFVGKSHISGFNFAVKRSCFEKSGGMDPHYKMSFDVDLGLRFKNYGNVVFSKESAVVTSTRRWEKQKYSALFDYVQAYLYTVWLRKPPPFKPSVIR